jgi:hypothetical protein
VRFITTHGFWRSVALEGVWIQGSSTAAVFEVLPVFKFGNDSVTATAIRAFGAKRTARGSESETIRRRRRNPGARIDSQGIGRCLRARAKRESFRGKTRALFEDSKKLQSDEGDLAKTMHHIAHLEHFLENEHREWLRLLLDAEWFI